MENHYKNLSVLDISEICAVARSTVSCWIAKKALPAHRFGKKYFVSSEDLILFLKFTSRPVPQVLLEQLGSGYPPVFRRLKKCWEYWQNEVETLKCNHCAVFKHHIPECFTVKNNKHSTCNKECHKCKYFAEYYWPRVAFVHQLQKPAAVYKDFCLWTGNKDWADLCGVNVERLIGAGMEEFIHTDSLKTMINYNKRLHQGDSTLPGIFKMFLNDQKGGKVEVSLFIIPLSNPMDTCLIIGEERRPSKENEVTNDKTETEAVGPFAP